MFLNCFFICLLMTTTSCLNLSVLDKFASVLKFNQVNVYLPRRNFNWNLEQHQAIFKSNLLQQASVKIVEQFTKSVNQTNTGVLLRGCTKREMFASQLHVFKTIFIGPKIFLFSRINLLNTLLLSEL